MGNDQGRRHRRKSRRKNKIDKPVKEPVETEKMVFVDRDNELFVWENHNYGRLPFKEPDDIEIIFYGDKLWQDDSDKWSLLVLVSDANNSSSDEN